MPLVCREWELEGAAGSSIRPRASWFAARPMERSVRGLRFYPEVSPQDVAVVVMVSSAAQARRGREGRGVRGVVNCLRSAEVLRPSTAESRGEGRKEPRTSLSFRARTGH